MWFKSIEVDSDAEAWLLFAPMILVWLCLVTYTYIAFQDLEQSRASHKVVSIYDNM